MKNPKLKDKIVVIKEGVIFPILKKAVDNEKKNKMIPLESQPMNQFQNNKNKKIKLRFVKIADTNPARKLKISKEIGQIASSLEKNLSPLIRQKPDTSKQIFLRYGTDPNGNPSIKTPITLTNRMIILKTNTNNTKLPMMANNPQSKFKKPITDDRKEIITIHNAHHDDQIVSNKPIICSNMLIPNQPKTKFFLKETQKYSPIEPGYPVFDSVYEIKEFAYKEEPNLSNRKTMEDFHAIHPNLFPKEKEKVAFFGIFDGHHGAESAIYCQNNFHKVLSHCLKSNNCTIEESLVNSFMNIDHQLKHVDNTNQSGTTATVVLIYKKVIYSANVGDSRCFVFEDNQSIKMTKDHNCRDIDEVKRIKASGGKVFNGRVYGSLELTRTLGDFDMKECGVTPNPTISKHKITSKDNFAIIASDGVWNVIKENDLLSIIKKNEDISAKQLCDYIVTSAIDKGTNDNVSCIVIKL